MLIWHDSWWLLLLAPALTAISTQIGFLGNDVGVTCRSPGTSPAVDFSACWSAICPG